MTELSLVRIDFRLMHGQVITGWLKQVSADTILIVDDQLAADKFMAQVFLAAKPAGIKVGIRSIEKAVDALKNNRFKSNKMLVLFKSVANVKKAFDMGFPLEKLQVGGLGNATNKVMISKELGPFGIRVVGIAPDILDRTPANNDEKYRAQAYGRGWDVNTDPEKFFQNYKTSIPLGRPGHLNEVADLVCFLISEHASYITGVTIPVSGGKSKG